jgi:hypothetical protein
VLRQAPVKVLHWLKRARLLLLEPLHDAEFRQLGGIAHLRGLKLGEWAVRADLWGTPQRYPMLEADSAGFTVGGWAFQGRRIGILTACEEMRRRRGEMNPCKEEHICVVQRPPFVGRQVCRESE